MRRALKWLGGGMLLLLTCGTVAIVVGPPKVPPDAIESAVDRTPARMDEAWALPVATAYGRQLHWQSNGSTCGPASLVNVRRSLGLAAEDESQILSATDLCWTGMCIPGLTLDELAEVARSKGDVEVTVLRDLTPDEFREHLRQSNDPGRRYTINFHREPIFGAGGGHHSPIGGYLEDRDLVLVLDVNHDFRPWLIERERLFAAMDTVDSMSDKKRGLLLIQPAGDGSPP